MLSAVLRDPQLAVLSVMAHGQGDVATAAAIGRAAADAILTLPQEQRELYSILIEAALSEAARKVVEMQPGIEKFFTEAHRRAYDRGMAEGKAEEAARLVLKLLSRRGITITDAQRHQILECSDLEVLDRWQDLAFSVTSVEELFA
jgi:hypothetical protein